MSLTQDQRSDVLSHIRTETSLFEEGCPICKASGFDNFTLSSAVTGRLLVGDIPPEGNDLGDSSLSVSIEVTCGACGHIITFHPLFIDKLDLDLK